MIVSHMGGAGEVGTIPIDLVKSFHDDTKG